MEQLTKEEFQHNRATWARYVQSKVEGHPEHHLLWKLMRGRDAFVAFPPIHTEHKLKHSKHRYQALEQAIEKAQGLVRLLAFIKDNATMEKFRDKNPTHIELAWRKSVKDQFDVTTYEMQIAGYFIVNEEAQAALHVALDRLTEEMKQKLA